MVPVRLAVRIVVAMDEPHPDAGFGERPALFPEWVLRLDIAQEDHARGRNISLPGGGYTSSENKKQD